MITMKYSSDGDSVWTKVYRNSPTALDWGYSVSIDDSLNVYSSGYGLLSVGNEIVTIKYDKSGNEKWIRKYPTLDGDYLRPTFSEIDKENNIIVVGKSYVSNTYDIVTMKYSPGGDLIWSRIYNGGSIDRANSLFIDINSNILIAGFSYGVNAGDYLILRYTSEGDTDLVKVVNGETSGSTDEAFPIVSDSIGNIYVTGYSQSMFFRYDYLTVKLDFKGKILWSKIYRSAYTNYAYYLSLDKNGSVYVSGEGETIGGNTGILSVKYSQLTGVESGDYLNLSSFNLKNYPNPFNPQTTIHYDLHSGGHLELKIFNIRGNKVANYVNKIQEKGSYKVIFDGSNLPSGVYFYSLYLDKELKETKRMLLVK